MNPLNTWRMLQIALVGNAENTWGFCTELKSTVYYFPCTSQVALGTIGSAVLRLAKSLLGDPLALVEQLGDDGRWCALACCHMTLVFAVMHL